MYLFSGIYTLCSPVIVLGSERPGWRKYLDPPFPACLPLASSDAAQIPRKKSRSYFHFTHPPTATAITNETLLRSLSFYNDCNFTITANQCNSEACIYFPPSQPIPLPSSLPVAFGTPHRTQKVLRLGRALAPTALDVLESWQEIE
jgi:hypothetical protein